MTRRRGSSIVPILPKLAMKTWAAIVDRPRLALEEDADRLVQWSRDVEVGREQVSGAFRNDPEHDVALGEGVDDLEDRAVSANRDNDVDLGLDGFARSLPELLLAD